MVGIIKSSGGRIVFRPSLLPAITVFQPVIFLISPNKHTVILFTVLPKQLHGPLRVCKLSYVIPQEQKMEYPPVQGILHASFQRYVIAVNVSQNRQFHTLASVFLLPSAALYLFPPLMGHIR